MYLPPEHFPFNLSIKTFKTGGKWCRNFLAGFWEIPLVNGKAFSVNFGKKDNLACYIQILKISYWEFLLHLTFIPEFPAVSGEWFSFQDFVFSGKFPYHLLLFQKFHNFG